jgi:ubiquinone/menaquinone biosynthesis C-methylase UbiE
MDTNNSSNSEALINRIIQNELNQNIDLNQWAFNCIKESEGKNILELCSGIGRQTECLLQKFKNSHLTCVDISEESLLKIKHSSFYKEEIMTLVCDGMDEFFSNNISTYDTIFVSYGLYYAKEIDTVLNKVYLSLKKGGNFIVLGPYGDNNKQLFHEVQKTGVEIDKYIIHTCSDFMYSVVINKMLGLFKSYTIDTVINEVKWNTIEDVLKYWRNTTFYDPNKCTDFLLNLKNHFLSNPNFINEKHIMLLQCLNKL